MSLDPARWKPAPLLPKTDARDGSLVFVVAVLVFLAGLTCLGALAADRAARGWTSQLQGSATVVVRPRGIESV
ncbi:MAG TPA: ABC transporter permease, partial [Candidatus Limnocylindria bacterium]|nr:ABC transporter permease [Candidatus Limnocylindria bacterium]